MIYNKMAEPGSYHEAMKELEMNYTGKIAGKQQRLMNVHPLTLIKQEWRKMTNHTKAKLSHRRTRACTYAHTYVHACNNVWTIKKSVTRFL